MVALPIAGDIATHLVREFFVIAYIEPRFAAERCPSLEDTMKLLDQRLGKSVRGPVNHKVYAPR